MFDAGVSLYSEFGLRKGNFLAETTAHLLIATVTFKMAFHMNVTIWAALIDLEPYQIMNINKPTSIPQCLHGLFKNELGIHLGDL